MLASLLLYSVHIPHEAPDSRFTFGDFASGESVCPRRDFALVAGTIPVVDTIPVADIATPGVNTNSRAGNTSGVDTDSVAGTAPVADTERRAGQRIGFWPSLIV
jgi:hypothetical protein